MDADNQTHQDLPDGAQDEITRELTQLDTSLAVLAECIVKEDRALPAEVYRLPIPLETPPLGDGSITPEILTGADARAEAGAVIRAWRYARGQDPKGVIRLPGVLLCGSNTQAALVEANAQKRVVADLLHKASAFVVNRLIENLVNNNEGFFGDIRDKNTTVRHMHVIQAKRPLRLISLDAGKHTFAFSWTGSYVTHRVKLKSEFADLIKRTVEKGPLPMSKDTPEEWEDRYNGYLAMLRDIPALESLVERRTMPPLPVLSLWPPGAVRGPIKASLPIFLTDNSGWPTIKSLPIHRPTDVEGAARKVRKHRARQIEETPLVEGLHLYRYKPEFRNKTRGTVRINRLEGKRTKLEITAKAFDGETVEWELSTADLKRALRAVFEGSTANPTSGLTMTPSGAEGVRLSFLIKQKHWQVVWKRPDAKKYLETA